MDFCFGVWYFWTVIQSSDITGDFPPLWLTPVSSDLIYEIPLDFPPYLPLFIVCHVKTDSLVSAAPDLWLELNMGKSWLDSGAEEVGQGWLGTREETFLRTSSLYSCWGQSCPKWGITWLVKLGAKNTKLCLSMKHSYTDICGSKISWGRWLEKNCLKKMGGADEYRLRDSDLEE